MKTIILMSAYIRKNVLPIILIIITLTVVIFNLVTIYGKYEYQTYSKNIYSSSGLNDSLYFYINIINDKETTIKKIDELRNQLNKYPDIKRITGYDYYYANHYEYIVNIEYYTTEMIEAFELPVLKGRWLSDNPEFPEAVVGGVVWNNVNIGDKIDFGYGYEVEVVGILPEITIFPSLSGYGTYLNTTQMFSAGNGMIFINKESLRNDIYNNIDKFPNFSFFIELSENISSEDKNNILSLLSQYGKYYTYDEIMNNTDVYIKQWLKENLPFPLFVLISLTMLILCITAVMTKQNLLEQSKYYLLGCSKKQSVYVTIITLFTIFIIPCFVNVIINIFYPNFLRAEMLSQIDYIIDMNCLSLVVVYIIGLGVYLIVLPLSYYKKYSPINLYKNSL